MLLLTLSGFFIVSCRILRLLHRIYRNKYILPVQDPWSTQLPLLFPESSRRPLLSLPIALSLASPVAASPMRRPPLPLPPSLLPSPPCAITDGAPRRSLQLGPLGPLRPHGELEPTVRRSPYRGARPLRPCSAHGGGRVRHPFQAPGDLCLLRRAAGSPRLRQRRPWPMALQHPWALTPEEEDDGVEASAAVEGVAAAATGCPTPAPPMRQMI